MDIVSAHNLLMADLGDRLKILKKIERTLNIHRTKQQNDAVREAISNELNATLSRLDAKPYYDSN